MSADSDILFPQEVDSLTFPDFSSFSEFEDFSDDILLVHELDGLSNEALLEDFNRIKPLLMDDFTTSLEGIKEEDEEEIPSGSKDEAVDNKSLLLDATTASEGSLISPRTMAATRKLNCMSLKDNMQFQKSKICYGSSGAPEQSGSPHTSLPTLVYDSMHTTPTIPLMASFLQDKNHIQTKDLGVSSSQIIESFFAGSQAPGMKGLKNCTVQSSVTEPSSTLPLSTPLRQATSNGNIKHIDARPTVSPSIFHINSPLSSPSSSVSGSVERSLFQVCRQEENLNPAKKPPARAELQSLADHSSFSSLPSPAADLFHGAMAMPCHFTQQVSRFPTMQRSQSSHALGQFRSSGHLMTCPEDFAVCTMEMPSSAGFLDQKQVSNYQASDAEELVKRSSITPIRRVFSTGDIQAGHGMQVCYGDNNTSRTDNSIEEFTMGMKVGHYTLEERKVRLHRYRKKRNERNFSKKIKYVCRKTLADSRPRIRGRFARTLDDSGEPLTRENGNFPDDEYHEKDALMTLSTHCRVPKTHGISFWNLAGVNPPRQNGM